MTDVLALPSPQAVSSLNSQEELVSTLDTLLERYLHLLDQHQTLQQELAERFSAVNNT